MAQTYAGAVGSAAAQGLLTAVWIASRELPPAYRRLARFGAGASVAVTGWYSSARDERVTSYTLGEGMTQRANEDAPPQPVDRRRMAVVAVASAVSVGALVGRRHLEKRWLARLQRNGHQHPHRALALRMGLLSVALTLPGKVMTVYEAQRKDVDLHRG